MKSLVSFCFLALLSLCSGDKQRVAVHPGMIPRGGGIFSRVIDVFESKSSIQITKETKSRAKNLDQSTEQMAQEAWKVAKAEQINLEKQLQTLSKQLKGAAAETSVELQRVALKKANLAEKLARQKAESLSSQIQDATKSKIQSLQESLLKKANDLDDRVTNLLLTGSTEQKPKNPIRANLYKSATHHQSLVDKMSALVICIGIVTGIGNALGIPKGFTLPMWEESGFGQGFFEFLNAQGWSVTDKRIAAGCLELLSVLTMLLSEKLRKVGAALVTILYGHGSWIQQSLNAHDKAVFAGVTAMLALLVVVADVLVM